MAEDKDDVQRTRTYGFGRFMLRYVPLAAVLLAFGVATQVWPDEFPKRGSMVFGFLLAVGSFIYIAFALVRIIEPGRPRLTLATDGIRQRLSRGRILYIPWDEVRDVVSVDHAVRARGFTITTRDVPAVVVSEAFYDREMPLKPWHRRSLDFGHLAEGSNGAVRILFRHDYFGTRAKDLRAAIETRWRAFSRHPNAKLPPRPDAPRRRGLLPPWLPRWVVKLGVVLCAVFAAYYVWAFVLMAPEVNEATRSHYLNELLDKDGVPARMADGRMALLRRADVVAAGVPQCELETTGDPRTSWRPVHLTGASCFAHLTLRSGEAAVAGFRLAVQSFMTEYQLGKFREERALVAARITLEEADAMLCRLGHCGAGAGRR